MLCRWSHNNRSPAAPFLSCFSPNKSVSFCLLLHSSPSSSSRRSLSRHEMFQYYVATLFINHRLCRAERLRNKNFFRHSQTPAGASLSLLGHSIAGRPFTLRKFPYRKWPATCEWWSLETQKKDKREKKTNQQHPTRWTSFAYQRSRSLAPTFWLGDDDRV